MPMSFSITRKLKLRTHNGHSRFYFVLCFLLYIMAIDLSFSQDIQSNNDNELIEQYVQSKGSGIIVFDSNNIKQFWPDVSVISFDNYFEIHLFQKESRFESKTLKIHLANVNETQSCNIDIITDDSDCSFSLFDCDSNILSSDNSRDTFVQNIVLSSLFHLERTQDLSFYLQFNSNTSDIIKIKKIILSFSNNKNSSFVVSPGTLNLSMNSVIVKSGQISSLDTVSFSVRGQQNDILSAKKILIEDDKPLSSSVKIKNTGDTVVRIYAGYAVYSKEHFLLDGKNYPYTDPDQILTVISSAPEKNQIIVDQYPDWRKGCYLALNAKRDSSDIPSMLLAGKIIDVKKLENNYAEITLDKSIPKDLKKGSKVRINGLNGSYLYTDILTLQPQEEKIITSRIQKDNSLLEYLPKAKAFPKGVYYVIPLILSYTVEPNKDNTVHISDFTISY